MVRTIIPSCVSGSIKAPSSKSMTQRAIAAAVLADGETTVMNPSYCDDSLAAITIATGLGADIEKLPGKIHISGSSGIKENILNCGESGLAIRMFSPIASLFPSEITLSGTGSLRKRPMSMIEEALRQLGVTCRSEGGYLPLTVRGPMRGGSCEIDGSISSQLLTGLLMALPVIQSDSMVKVYNLKSRPYIDMTIQVLEKFGINVVNEAYSGFTIRGNQKYKSCSFEVEGDWSGSAFLLVAGAVAGDVTVYGLRPDSRQSDKAILSALDKSGAKMSISDDSVRVSQSELNAFEFDATESPDLFPPLAALASYCRGTSVIMGVSRLIHKESNRASALVEEFDKMKIRIEIRGNKMFITGGRISGAQVNSHGDHRIAMAAAAAALGALDKVVINDSQCIAKSYPGFFEDLKKLGALVEE